MVPCHLSNSAFKKNPFLGPDLLWFANPNTPNTPGGAESDEALKPLTKELLNVVPGNVGDPEKLFERKERWITLLGDYNQVQIYIDYLYDKRKQLNDPALFKQSNYPDYIKRLLDAHYQEMGKIIGVLPNTENSLKDSIQKNISSKLKADRLGALQTTDRLIAALFKQRKVELAKVGETLRQDLTERVVNLRKKWEGWEPPENHEKYQKGWLEYCDKTLSALEKFDPAALDDGTKDSPMGHELLKEAEEWWNAVGHLEDGYENFTKVDTSQFSVTNVEAKFAELKAKKEALLTDEFIKEFRKNADLVLARGRRMESLIDAKMKEWEHDHSRTEDVKILTGSKEQLKDKLKQLEEQKNVREEVEKTFNSTKKAADFKLAGDETIEVPEGIAGQIEVLRLLPASTDGYRQMMRTLLDSMKGLEQQLGKYQEFSQVSLPQALIDMDLFEKGIDTNLGKGTRELMFMNPFATVGHLWHSYTEAIKGHVETDEKRGAGYWQKGATEIFTKMPKIPGIENLSVVKSLTELSINGAVEAEHAEHHRIGEYEKNYEGVPPDHLAHMATEASDQWELLGCLKVLASKHGRIDWYAEWLFKMLNQYQHTVKIPEDKHWHMRNITRSNELLRQAFSYIYRDEEVYRSLRNNNLSTYENKMGEYNKQWGGIAAEPGALKNKAEEILEKFIQDHHAGVHFSKQSPIEFESIIRYGIDQGKMKMEDRIRLLIRGIAEGLLSIDRGVNATDKTNTYPPLDFFDTGTGRGGRPTIDDFWEWNEYAKDPVKWDYFMHKSDGVMNNKAVNERLIKTMTQGSHRLDHDDAPGIAGYLTMDITRDLLKQKTSGGYGMPVTGLKSLATGNEFWLHMFAEEYGKRTPEQNRNELIRFAAQFMMYDGILNNRVFKESQDFYRLRPGMESKEPPRNDRGSYAKVFKIKDKVKSYNMNAGTAEIVSDTAKKIMMLDLEEPQLLHMLLRDEIKTNDQAKVVCAKLEQKTGLFKGQAPTTIDDIYKKLPDYFEYVVVNNSEAVERMVQAIKAEHGQQVGAFDHAVEGPIHHIREAAKQRGITGRAPEGHGDHGGHDAHGGGHGHGGHDDHHGGDHHDAHGGGHGHNDEHGHEGEHPTEGHGHAANNGFHYDDHSDASHGSTHGHHKAA